MCHILLQASHVLDLLWGGAVLCGEEDLDIVHHFPVRERFFPQALKFLSELVHVITGLGEGVLNEGLAIALALALRRGKRRTLRWRITHQERDQYRELLKTLDLGLENRLTSKVGLLSGGQRQALTLLMATLTRPKLLLLDEPTAALDPKTAAKVLEISDRIIAENQLTALMVTHNMRDAIKHGNRLIMLKDGQIILDISGEEKKNLTVENLLAKFAIVAGEELANDRMLLS